MAIFALHFFWHCEKNRNLGYKVDKDYIILHFLSIYIDIFIQYQEEFLELLLSIFLNICSKIKVPVTNDFRKWEFVRVNLTSENHNI